MDAHFKEQLRERLSPVLRKGGFRGTGQRYRRAEGEMLHAVTIQGARAGGSCCVELGIHLRFLPSPSGRPVDASKLTSYDCEWRTRLARPGQGNTWWDYGGTLGAARASVADLVATFEAVALPLFGQFESFPGRFAAITPADIQNGAAGLPALVGSVPRCALAMARVAERLGRPDSRRAFAELGLRCVQGGPIERELRSLLAQSET